MKTAAAVIILAAGLRAQNPAVEIELMTYPEIHDAIHQRGMSTVIIYNGGTEQRGPHAVLGGHTIMARATAAAIARRLGHALVAPVLPFSPAGSHLNPAWPGSVNLPPALYAAVNEAVVDSMVVNGFKNIVLIGDHGGGQKELELLAGKMNAKYASKGMHVYYSGAGYYKTRDDFNAWLKANHLPLSTHAGIPDTSELMYLGGDQYVRKDKMAAGNGKNGVAGDPRPSTPEIGKRLFDMRVATAAEEIKRLLAAGR